MSSNVRSQTCHQCGTRLNITGLADGTKFACSNCGTILHVGQRPKATKRSLKDSGPAFQPKKADDDAPSVPTRTRRRAAADAPADGAAPSKSKLPLFIGGGVVVVGVILAVILAGGGEGGPGGGGGSGGGGGETAGSWWNSVSAKVGSGDADTLRGILAHAQEKGYDENPAFWDPKASDIYANLLRRDKNDPAANRFFGRKSLKGYPEFELRWTQLNEHFKVLPDEFRTFLQTHAAAIDSGKDVWMTADEYAGAKGVLDRFVVWKKELDADPSPEQIAKGLAIGQQFAPDFGALPEVARPFLVFVASRTLRDTGAGDGEAERLAAAQAKLAPAAKRIGKALVQVGQQFDTRVRAPLELPEIANDTVLRHWIYDEPAPFQARRAGERGKDFRQIDRAAFFGGQSRWCYGWIQDDENELKHLERDIGWAAVQQLYWFYCKEGKFKDHYGEWNGVWFNFGLADYLGAGLTVSDASAASFTGKPPRRTAHLKRVKDNGLPYIPLKDLVEQATPGALDRWVDQAYVPSLVDMSEDLPETANQLARARAFHIQTYYAQSWALIHFLNEYENGKYKQAFLDLFLTSVRGRAKGKHGSGRWNDCLDAFTGILGLQGADDWARLEREYRGHLGGLGD